MKYIVQCPICGQMYKTEGKPSVKGLQYITDYNDNVTNHCLKCDNKITPKVIKTEDWIADMVFKIKGS